MLPPQPHFVHDGVTMRTNDAALTTARCMAPFDSSYIRQTPGTPPSTSPLEGRDRGFLVINGHRGDRWLPFSTTSCYC